MADKTPKESRAHVATRIDPTKQGLSKEQLHFIQQVELEQWRKNIHKLRTRNAVTGLAIGTVILGLLPDGYTVKWLYVNQENNNQNMNEMDEEAKRARMQGPKTGAD